MKAKSILFASAAAFLGFSGALSAQEVKRTEIERHDLTGTNMDVILSVIEMAPGAKMIRHSHHGEEAVYILDTAQVQLPGKDPIEFTAGDGTINVRDVAHGGFTVVGSKVLRMVSVHVVDKGKELYEPSK